MSGKGKGSNWERDICKYLTKWLTGKEKPYAFWRMPGSGGLATIDELNKNLSGDIRAIIPEAEFMTDTFSIEAKIGYPKTSFWQHFKGIKNFHIKDFWVQCSEDASKPGKYPMLIYRKLRQKAIVGINKIADDLLKYHNKKLKSVNFIEMSFCEENINSIVFYDMDDFFKIIKPKDIKRLVGIKI